MVGPWQRAYGIGVHGVDPVAKTAWAVVNYQGEFRVANQRQDVNLMACGLERLAAWANGRP